jgi:chaperonin GroES
MSVTILYDRVLIKKLEVEEKTVGGIVLTGSATDPVFEGEVVKVGEGKLTKEKVLIPLTVKVGDKVIYDPNAAIDVTIDGEKFLVLREENIFAVKE